MFKWLKNRQKKHIELDNSKYIVNNDLEYILSNVKYSTEPHENIPFSEEERIFFKALVEQCTINNINPKSIMLTRMSDHGFNIDTPICYVGKINFYIAPDKYAVIKTGNKRASKIYTSRFEAEEFLSNHTGYNIEIRQGENRRFMQYLIGLYKIKVIENPTLEKCIATIPYWIRYIKYCNRN